MKTKTQDKNIEKIANLIIQKFEDVGQWRKSWVTNCEAPKNIVSGKVELVSFFGQIKVNTL